MSENVVEWAENGLADWQEGDVYRYVMEYGHPHWTDIVGYILATEARLASARAIMQRFVDKVDTGRARSTETYAEMKQWMEDE